MASSSSGTCCCSLPSRVSLGTRRHEQRARCVLRLRWMCAPLSPMLPPPPPPPRARRAVGGTMIIRNIAYRTPLAVGFLIGSSFTMVNLMLLVRALEGRRRRRPALSSVCAWCVRAHASPADHGSHPRCALPCRPPSSVAPRAPRPGCRRSPPLRPCCSSPWASSHVRERGGGGRFKRGRWLAGCPRPPAPRAAIHMRRPMQPRPARPACCIRARPPPPARPPARRLTRLAACCSLCHRLARHAAAAAVHVPGRRRRQLGSAAAAVWHQWQCVAHTLWGAGRGGGVAPAAPNRHPRVRVLACPALTPPPPPPPPRPSPPTTATMARAARRTGARPRPRIRRPWRPPRPPRAACSKIADVCGGGGPSAGLKGWF